jgi:hypothetical protein
MNPGSLITILFSLRWRSFRRQPCFVQHLVIKTFSFLIALYVATLVAASGYFLPDALVKWSIDPFSFVNVWLLILLLGVNLIKILNNKVKTLNILPFLTLPIKRRQLYIAYLLTAAVSVFDLYLLIFYSALGIRLILPMGILSFAGWMMTLMLLMWALDIWALLALHVRLMTPGRFFATLLLVATLLFLGNGIQWLPTLSQRLMGSALHHVYAPLFAFLFVCTAFSVGQAVMQRLSRLDPPVYGFGWNLKLPEFKMQSWSFMQLLRLHMRLMLRCHVPRFTLIAMGFYSIVLGTFLILLPQERTNGTITIMLIMFTNGLLVFGSLSSNIMAWEVGYVSKILTSRVPAGRYLLSQYVVTVAPGLLFFVLGLIAVVGFKPAFLFIYLSISLYSYGVLGALAMWRIAHSKSKQSPTGSVFNVAKSGQKGIPLLITLLALYAPWLPPMFVENPDQAHYPDTFIMIWAAMGAVALILMPLWVARVSRLLNHRKYELVSISYS